MIVCHLVAAFMALLWPLKNPAGNCALGFRRSESPYAIPFAVSNESTVERTHECLDTSSP